MQLSKRVHALWVVAVPLALLTSTFALSEELTSTPPDFWIKDCGGDLGAQPSPCATFFWGAPDVTVENHDGPGSDIVWTVGFNRLRMLVRNRGGDDNTACRVFAYQQKAGAGMQWACSSGVVDRLLDAQGSYLCFLDDNFCDIGIPDNLYIDHNVLSASTGEPYEWYWQYPSDVLDPDQHWCLGFVIHPGCEGADQFPPGQSFDPQTSFQVVPDNNVAQVNMQELFARSQGSGPAVIHAPMVLDTMRTKLRAWNTTGSTTAIGFTMDTSNLSPGWSATWSPTSAQAIPNDSFFVVTLSIVPPASPTHDDSSVVDFRTFRLVAPATILGGVRIIARTDLQRPKEVTDLSRVCPLAEDTCHPSWLSALWPVLDTLDYFAPMEWSVPTQDTANDPERIMFFYVCRSEGDPNVDLSDKIDSVAMDFTRAVPKFQYLDVRQPSSIVDSVYYRVYAVDGAHRISNIGNRIAFPLCRWLNLGINAPSNPHPADNATNVDLNSTLVWNASGNVALDADFNNKTLDAPIGTGGAAVGEPAFIDAGVQAIVRSGPAGLKALELTDVASSLAHAVDFRFLNVSTFLKGVVTLQADLWFDQADSYEIGVQTSQWHDPGFVTLTISPTGMATIVDGSGTAGSVPAPVGRWLNLLIRIDQWSKTYDLWLDGVPYVQGRNHGLPLESIGSFYFAIGPDANLSGRMYVDNIHVTRDILCPITYDVQFGTNNPPTTLLCEDAPAPFCDPGTLANANTYFWRVTARRGNRAVVGPVWRFSTLAPVVCDAVVIDSTWWDEQTFGTDLRRVAAGDASSTCVHFAWTHADFQTFPPEFHSGRYNTWDLGGNQLGGGATDFNLAANSGGRYASVVPRDDNAVVAGTMQREDINFPYWPYTHEFPFPCMQTFSTGTPAPSFGELLYPVHDVGPTPGNFIHLIAAFPFGDGLYQLFYYRYDPAGGIWQGGLPLAMVDRLAYSIVASRRSDKVAVSYLTRDLGSLGRGNVAYQLSQNGGQNWVSAGVGPPTIVTNYVDCDTSAIFEFCNYGEYDITTAYDPDDSLHIVWTTRWAYSGESYRIATWSDLMHWTPQTGIRLVYQGPLANPDNLSAHDMPLSKPSLGIGNGDLICSSGDNRGYLYVVFTEFDGESTWPNPPPDASAKGFINGELFFTRSADNGVTWTSPQNITNTTSAGCDPAINAPCASEHWAAINREVGTRADITYIEDHDAGSAVSGDGDWTNNAVIYRRLCDELADPCIEPTPNFSTGDGLRSGYYNSNFFIRRSGRFFPGYYPNGPGAAFDTDTVRIFNNGTGAGDITLTLADPGESWLRVNGMPEDVISIPAGGSALVELSWYNNGIFTPVSTVLTVDDGTPQDFDFTFTPTLNPVRFLENLTVEVSPGDSFATVVTVDDPLITYAPPGLRALSLPPTATFTDNGDGTGRFTYQRPLVSLAKMATQAASDTAVIEAFLSCGGACTSTDTLLVILSEPGCSCPCKYDPQCDGVISNVQDVIKGVNVAFRGVAPELDAGCPRERTDVDADGVTSVTDVVKLINVAFRGQSAATTYVDPCGP